VTGERLLYHEPEKLLTALAGAKLMTRQDVR
jgi:hypothetical protein